MESRKPHPLTEEQAYRLKRYRRTLIDPACYAYYKRDHERVEKALEAKGFKNPRCWVSETKDPTTGTMEETILIQAEGKEGRE